MKKKVYVIGIGGIGTSGIARYYAQKWYDVFGSDTTFSHLIESLQQEGMDILIWERADFIDSNFEKVIYSEAISPHQSELQQAKNLHIPTLSYPEALWEISNKKTLISVAWSHGKSTTSSLISLMLHTTLDDTNAVVGTLLKEFDGKNTHFSESDFFVIEACEYKRSFLNYTPSIAVITNIDLDHLDYYKDLDDYLDAFTHYIKNIKSGWYLIIDGNDQNSKKLTSIRDDITLIEVFLEYYIFGGKKYLIPDFTMKIPGNHIKLDANIAYTIGKILHLTDDLILHSLQSYSGVWRRSEIVWETMFWNILMSDYGHHPTEIQLTLPALKKMYPEKELVVIFQPHQYSRTLELLDGFQRSFWSADLLIIPDIYQSRDSEEDMKKIDGEKLTHLIHHPNKVFWNGLENTLKIINTLDETYPGKYVFLLQGAGDVDTLRDHIQLKTSKNT